MKLFNLVDDAKAKLMAPGAPFELTDHIVNGQTFQKYCNAPVNLSDVINASRRDDDQTFLVYQGDKLTYRTFFEQVDSLASYLNEQGIVQGDRVAIAMRNRPEWVVSFCAVALIGAVPAPLNSFGMEQELVSALNTVDPKFLICDGGRWQRINQTQAWTTKALVLNDMNLNIADYGNASDLSIALTHPAGDLPLLNIVESDPALVLFTSGASSAAKAVVSSHLAVCQAIYNIDFIGAIAAMASPKALARIMAKGLIPTILTAVPLFHVSGLHAQLLSALRGGRRLVFTHKWDPVEAIDLIKQEQVTQFNGAPSMVMQLLRDPNFDTPEVMKSFCALGFGGAGIPTGLIDKALLTLSEHMIGSGFGMTETNGVGAASSGDIFRYSPKSSGLMSPIINAKICGRDGEALPANGVGEVCLSGVTLMSGYFNDEAATKEAYRDGWLRTGDLGFIDENGFLFIVDRIKDVINRAGENITSAEIESCLLQHEGVEEAAVFGIPDDETGEAVIAVVRLLQADSHNEDTLKNHVAQCLAKYKVPSKIHISIEQLPRNPAGKLQKNVLKKSLY